MASIKKSAVWFTYNLNLSLYCVVDFKPSLSHCSLFHKSALPWMDTSSSKVLITSCRKCCVSKYTCFLKKQELYLPFKSLILSNFLKQLLPVTSHPRQFLFQYLHPASFSSMPPHCSHFFSLSLLRSWLLFLFNRSVMSNFLRPYGVQHSRLPCPSRVCSNSCSLSQ